MLDRLKLARRALIGRTMAAGVAAALPQLAHGARPGRASAQGKIDVHFHLNLRSPGPPIDNSRFGRNTPALALEDMEKGGVAAAICSPGGGIGGGEVGPQKIRKSRDWNDRTAQVCADHPTRFGLFASLPLPDIEGALREIEYASDHLKADGFAFVTNYGDIWLGDLRFKPVYEELNRRGAVVYVHPTDAPCCSPEAIGFKRPPINGAWIEWPMNTARTMLSLMANGIFRDYPNIRFIFSHSGGLMPLLLSRISGFSGWDWVGPKVLADMFPDGIEAEFKKCYFDIAQGFAPANFQALMHYASPGRILYGSDFPFFSTEHSTAGIDRLRLKPQLRQAIEFRNAMALFPRWST